MLRAVGAMTGGVVAFPIFDATTHPARCRPKPLTAPKLHHERSEIKFP